MEQLDSSDERLGQSHEEIHARIAFRHVFAEDNAPKTHKLFQQKVFNFQKIQDEAKKAGTDAFLREVMLSWDGMLYVRYSIGDDAQV